MVKAKDEQGKITASELTKKHPRHRIKKKKIVD